MTPLRWVKRHRSFNRIGRLNVMAEVSSRAAVSRTTPRKIFFDIRIIFRWERFPFLTSAIVGEGCICHTKTMKFSSLLVTLLSISSCLSSLFAFSSVFASPQPRFSTGALPVSINLPCSEKLENVSCRPPLCFLFQN